VYNSTSAVWWAALTALHHVGGSMEAETAAAASIRVASMATQLLDESPGHAPPQRRMD
jgi:hypothetical protein